MEYFFIENTISRKQFGFRGGHWKCNFMVLLEVQDLTYLANWIKKSAIALEIFFELSKVLIILLYI